MIEQMSNERLARIITAHLYLHHPFFGAVLSATGGLVVSSQFETAATDGYRIYIGADFARRHFGSVVFVTLHELYHFILRHVSRRARRDLNPRLFNIAADLYINESLLRDGFKIDDVLRQQGVFLDTLPSIFPNLPSTAIPSDLAQRSVEDIYAFLAAFWDEAAQQQQLADGEWSSGDDLAGVDGQQGQQGQQGQGDQQDQGQQGQGDQQDQGQQGQQGQRDQQDQGQQGQRDQQDQGQQGQDGQRDQQGQDGQRDQQGQDGQRDQQGQQGQDGQGQDGKPDPTLTEAAVQAAIREYVQGRGMKSIPSSLTPLVADLLKPRRRPWHEALLPYIRPVGSVTDWTRPTRAAYAVGAFLPRTQPVTPLLHVLTIVDVSGSCYELVPDFLDELAQLAFRFRLRMDVAACDTEVIFSARDIKSLAQLRALQFPLGGGTDLRAAFPLVDPRRHRVVVVFTDGDTPWPERSEVRRVPVVVVCPFERNLAWIPSWMKGVAMED